MESRFDVSDDETIVLCGCNTYGQHRAETRRSKAVGMCSPASCKVSHAPVLYALATTVDGARQCYREYRLAGSALQRATVKSLHQSRIRIRSNSVLFILRVRSRSSSAATPRRRSSGCRADAAPRPPRLYLAETRYSSASAAREGMASSKNASSTLTAKEN